MRTLTHIRSSFNKPYAKEHMNSWNHAPDSYQPQRWNGQYPSPDYFGNHSKNFYQGAPGQHRIPPSQNSHVYHVTSMSVITRSKRPSNSEKAPSNTPQPKKPRSNSSNTPSIMEISATPTVLSTPTLLPTNPIVVPSIQNTVHTHLMLPRQIPLIKMMAMIMIKPVIVNPKMKTIIMRKISLRQLVTAMPSMQITKTRVTQAVTQTTAMMNPMMVIITKGPTLTMKPTIIIKWWMRSTLLQSKIN